MDNEIQPLLAAPNTKTNKPPKQAKSTHTHASKCSVSPITGLRRRSYPIYKPLVELLHGALQLALLVLPLFIVTHCLHCGALPCGGARDVIHKVGTAHLVNTTFPSFNMQKENKNFWNRKTNLCYKEKE